MSPVEIMEQTKADGLALSVSPDSNLRIVGDQEEIDAWLEDIRENKEGILAELRTRHVLQELEADPRRKYAVLVTDTSTDPVLVKVGIRGIGTFDMAIPRAHYDGIALLEVLEQHSREQTEPQRNVA